MSDYFKINTNQFFVGRSKGNSVLHFPKNGNICTMAICMYVCTYTRYVYFYPLLVLKSIEEDTKLGLEEQKKLIDAKFKSFYNSSNNAQEDKLKRGQ